MTSRRNALSLFDSIRTGLQARAVLDVVAKERCTNNRVLETWLTAIGLTASSRTIAELLDRMAADGLVRLEQVDDFQVIRLLRLGGEVASGQEHREWIAKPELPM